MRNLIFFILPLLLLAIKEEDKEHVQVNRPMWLSLLVIIPCFLIIGWVVLVIYKTGF